MKISVGDITNSSERFNFVESTDYGITKFIKTIGNQGGPASKAKFIVNIYPIRGFQGYFEYYGVKHYHQTLSFLCTNSSLLGKTISTADAKVYGPIEKMPYEVLYEDLTLDFLCTDFEFSERKFFDAWMNSIVDPVTRDINYKDQYITNIDIFQMNHKHQVIYAQRVSEAFPTLLNSQELDWDASDTEQKLSVTFAYRDWKPII